MATRLYLVRHGATQLTAEDRFSGAVGVDLSDDGWAQVDRLARRLPGLVDLVGIDSPGLTSSSLAIAVRWSASSKPKGATVGARPSLST